MITKKPVHAIAATLLALALCGCGGGGRAAAQKRRELLKGAGARMMGPCPQ